jgi:hypothetical protein
MLGGPSKYQSMSQPFGGLVGRQYVMEGLHELETSLPLKSLAGMSVPYYLEGFEAVAKTCAEQKKKSRKR